MKKYRPLQSNERVRFGDQVNGPSTGSRWEDIDEDAVCIGEKVSFWKGEHIYRRPIKAVAQKTPRKKAKKVSVSAKRSHNIPVAEMTWVREAFAICMKYAADESYREMWRTRKNAVLWSLRHR